MQLDYLQYWGLSRPPFALTPDPEMLFLTQQHEECLLRLRYAVASNKGGALLISQNAGDGKTSILRRLLLDLKHDYGEQSRVAFLDHPTVTANQMIAEIARQIGVERTSRNKLVVLSDLRELLLDLRDKGAKCVVIVDEGQMLAMRPEILQELRILLNFCVSDSFLMTFILSGQKPLEPAVRSMPEFWQRLPVRFSLRSLNVQDTRRMIRFRLEKAGAEDLDIFTRDAVSAIHTASEGCPRVVCSIADLSLVIGHSQRVKEIEASEVAHAFGDLEKESGGGFHYFHFVKSLQQKRTATRRFVRSKIHGEAEEEAATNPEGDDVPPEELTDGQLLDAIGSLPFLPKRQRGRGDEADGGLILDMPIRTIGRSPRLEIDQDGRLQAPRKCAVRVTADGVTINTREERIVLPYERIARAEFGVPEGADSATPQEIAIFSGTTCFHIGLPFSVAHAEKLAPLIATCIDRRGSSSYGSNELE